MTLQGNPHLVENGLNDPPENPIILMKKWFRNAELAKISEPFGFTIATVDKCGMPSSRVILMKECDDFGIVFSSSINSKKGKDFQENSIASASFWWKETIQQIILLGNIVCLSDDFSDNIFARRTRAAQAVVKISNQSEPMVNECKLRDDVLALVKSGSNIVRPLDWIAFRLEPYQVEFWQGSKDRFHKRLMYKRQKNELWQKQWLQP